MDSLPQPPAGCFPTIGKKVSNHWKIFPAVLRRLLAWSYDILLALFAVGWVLWGEIILARVLGIAPEAWNDHVESWCCELEKYGQENGISGWRCGLLSNLPVLIEWGAVLAISLLLVLLVRRLSPATPGEWTFSVRRPPFAPPAGGFWAALLRAVVGVGAFAFALGLATALSLRRV